MPAVLKVLLPSQDCTTSLHPSLTHRNRSVSGKYTPPTAWPGKPTVGHQSAQNGTKAATPREYVVVQAAPWAVTEEQYLLIKIGLSPVHGRQ